MTQAVTGKIDPVHRARLDAYPAGVRTGYPAVKDS